MTRATSARPRSTRTPCSTPSRPAPRRWPAVSTIVPPRVRDVAQAVGGFATEVFEIREAARRAARGAPSRRRRTATPSPSRLMAAGPASSASVPPSPGCCRRRTGRRAASTRLARLSSPLRRLLWMPTPSSRKRQRAADRPRPCRGSRRGRRGRAARCWRAPRGRRLRGRPRAAPPPRRTATRVPPAAGTPAAAWPPARCPATSVSRVAVSSSARAQGEDRVADLRGSSRRACASPCRPARARCRRPPAATCCSESPVAKSRWTTWSCRSRAIRLRSSTQPQLRRRPGGRRRARARPRRGSRRRPAMSASVSVNGGESSRRAEEQHAEHLVGPGAGAAWRGRTASVSTPRELLFVRLWEPGHHRSASRLDDLPCPDALVGRVAVVLLEGLLARGRARA